MEVSNQPNHASGAVAVAGAGIAGMQASLDLAEAGYLVYLIERDVSIGGVMAQLDKTFPTNDCSTCMISPKLIEVAANPNIKIISRAEIKGMTGEPGNFTLSVEKAPRFIDEDLCSGCGECVKVCPVEVPADFNQGLNRRKAIFRHFPQAIPSAFAVEKMGTSPCKAACPAGVSAQGYVALIGQGKFAEALALVRKNNPLPGVCGRVCTHPCEDACSRASLDEAVAVRELKRFVSDWELENGAEEIPVTKEKNGRKVAIIGSGPAGLTAAYYLALDGYSPTIYEALPVAGGMLRVGIPSYRLPREILDYEINHILKAGAELELNQALGHDFSLESLRDDGFEAIYLATGAHKPMPLRTPGENLPGVQTGVDFLREASLDKAECPGKNIAVIGGGNVAMDAARTALRLGSEKVTILYRRTREEMPAYDEEIEEALEEGIAIEYLSAPVAFEETGGRVSGVKVIKMELGEPDESGRRRPVPVEGSEYTLPIDGALSAIGQRPDLDYLEPKTDLELEGGYKLKVMAAGCQTNLTHVFAGGDAVTGAASAIEAIAAGRQAAEAIACQLEGRELPKPIKVPERVAKVPTEGLAKVKREKPSHADCKTRGKNFDEVVAVFNAEQAKREADRCLACGVCSECYQCLDVCQAKAINHNAQPQQLNLEVGAVIMAPGFKPYEARLKGEYGHGRYPNVITSLEFERILSASGPFEGHVKRPGDGTEPKKVAWIQCVGSRDAANNRDYCSYICCMQACKQAIIAGEHVEGLSGTVFYMDIRAQGKGFDRYYQRARDDHGVRFIRSMPSRITQDAATGDLLMQYQDETGVMRTEAFDMVILSVGLVSPPKNRELAETLNVDTDKFGFAGRQELNPIITSQEGVYACGVFQAPRDIPDTVMQASGAAAQAGELLSRGRGSRVSAKEYPPELAMADEAPRRIGVFICHCGINIGSVVDVPEVVRYAAGLPGVVCSDEFLFTCSTDSQEKITALIKEHNLNRVVVASCSPRTHEELFRNSLSEAGLNPYLFEMANIRDQCSWVHQQDHPKATAKAKDLVRMSVARAGLLQPLHQFPVPVVQGALIIGGGVAGMTAALSLAEQGFRVDLVERGSELGGMARKLHTTPEGFEVGAFLTDLSEKVSLHPNIETHFEAEVKSTSGHVGDMISNLSVAGQVRQVNHGALILATGAKEHRPTTYMYEDDDVLTQLELHEALHQSGLNGTRSVVMIQCVGSREPGHDYCSRLCCSQAVANALKIKELDPEAEVYVLYRDIRTYALKELLYQQARRLGVRFIRFDAENPPLVRRGENSLEVLVYDQALRDWLALTPDKIALAAAVRPQDDAHQIASKLKLPLDSDGFFMEAHLKLRPVDFASAGCFVCGAAHGPKPLEEVISQAKAAAGRAATCISHQEMMVGGEVAVVDGECCVACLTCVRTCAYGVPIINDEGVAYIDPAACHGCGACAAACPRKLITVGHHTDEQILAKATTI